MLEKGFAKNTKKILIWISNMFANYEKQYSAKSSDLHTPWIDWRCFLSQVELVYYAWITWSTPYDLYTWTFFKKIFFLNHPTANAITRCQPLFRWTHFKYPVRFLLLIQIHPGLAENSVLCRCFKRQVKLRPLQVETQTCSDGFDETLF